MKGRGSAVLRAVSEADSFYLLLGIVAVIAGEAAEVLGFPGENSRRERSLAGE